MAAMLQQIQILGGGVSGVHAAEMAIGARANVTVFDRSMPRLEELDVQFAGAVDTVYATQAAIDRAVLEADLVIGAVLIPGAAAPKLVTREHLRKMKPGAVSLEKLTKRGTPAAIAASSRLNVAIRLFSKTTSGGWWNGWAIPPARGRFR